MEQANVYLKRERLSELEKELMEMKSAKRKEVADKIAEARAHGDLSENAEYDAAKEAQSMLELKISKLENTLSRAIIIEDDQFPGDEVHILSQVHLLDITNEEEIKYLIVSPDEADIEMDKISIVSPLGKMMMGRKKGEKFTLELNGNKNEYKILGISN
ncbi:MAG TPA: transcription elongation factor GreA [Ignavibacteria bacterium]|nr:transcription elongation factor GreA [Ignavibacteria bacterium]